LSGGGDDDDDDAGCRLVVKWPLVWALKAPSPPTGQRVASAAIHLTRAPKQKGQLLLREKQQDAHLSRPLSEWKRISDQKSTTRPAIISVRHSSRQLLFVFFPLLFCSRSYRTTVLTLIPAFSHFLVRSNERRAKEEEEEEDGRL
jgi:hypothetical protein